MSFIYCEALVVVMLNCVLSVHVGVLAFLTQQYIHSCVHLLYPVMIVHCVMVLCPLYSSHYDHVLMAHFCPSPPQTCQLPSSSLTHKQCLSCLKEVAILDSLRVFSPSGPPGWTGYSDSA